MRSSASEQSIVRDGPSEWFLLIAWLTPVAYFIHLLEEFYAGVKLPVWLNNNLGADLSNSDFLWINGVAMGIVLLNAIAFTVRRGNVVVLIAIVALFTINGAIHGLASLIWGSYVPGTVSGLLIYLPCGIVVLRRLQSRVTPAAWRFGVLAGVLIHLAVIVISRNV